MKRPGLEAEPLRHLERMYLGAVTQPGDRFGFNRRDAKGVDAWAAETLPFEPKTVWQREFRGELQRAVSALEVGDLEILQGFYRAPNEPQDVTTGTENILFSNVGLACFENAAKHGLRFER